MREKQEKTPKEPTRTRGRGRRPRVWFQLDMNRKQDVDTDLLIKDLRSRRRFMPTLRAGLRLVDDLYHGNIDVLLELFPFVEDAILARLQRRSSDLDDVLNMLHQLQDRLDDVGAPPSDRVNESADFVAVESSTDVAANLDDMLDAFDF